jgi:hypothetical protein
MFVPSGTPSITKYVLMFAPGCGPGGGGLVGAGAHELPINAKLPTPTTSKRSA